MQDIVRLGDAGDNPGIPGSMDAWFIVQTISACHVVTLAQAVFAPGMASVLNSARVHPPFLGTCQPALPEVGPRKLAGNGARNIWGDEVKNSPNRLTWGCCPEPFCFCAGTFFSLPGVLNMFLGVGMDA